MAEAVMREKCKNYDIIVDSCGTSGYHNGEIPHLGTRKVLDWHKISYEGIHSRQIKRSDFDEFDYIIGMDNSNIEDLRRIKDSEKIHKLTDWALKLSVDYVSDPYYNNNFDEVFNIIDDSTDGLLEFILKENKKLAWADKF